MACLPSTFGVYVYLHRIACYCTFPLWHGCYLPHMVCLPSLSGLSTFPVWHVSFLYGLSILSLYDVSTISIWRVYLYHPHKACLPSTFGVYTFPIWGVFLFLNGLSTTPHSMSTFFCHTACLLSTFPVWRVYILTKCLNIADIALKDSNVAPLRVESPKMKKIKILV